MTTKIGVEDFSLLKTLGRGTFGKVMLVQKKVFFNFLIKFKGQSAILRNEKYKKTNYS